MIEILLQKLYDTAKTKQRAEKNMKIEIIATRNKSDIVFVSALVIHCFNAVNAI